MLRPYIAGGIIIKIAARFRSSILWLSASAAYISMICVVVILLLILLDVAMRQIVGKSIMVAEELGGYLVVAIVFLGLSYTLRVGEHVSVGLLVRRLSPEVRYIVHLVTTTLSIGVIGVAVWQIWVLVVKSYSDGTLSLGNLRTPQYIPQIVVFVGVVLFALQAIAKLLETREQFWEEGKKEADRALE